MLKPFLIVLLLIAAVKTGFAKAPDCYDMEGEQVTSTSQSPIVEIRNPTR